MRDPAHTSYLPTLLAARTDLQTALNRIDAYEKLSALAEWGAGAAVKQAGAYATVCARVQAAYNRLDLGPTERERFHAERTRLRDENMALRETVQRLTIDNQRLTAANVAALEGRKAA